DRLSPNQMMRMPHMKTLVFLGCVLLLGMGTHVFAQSRSTAEGVFTDGQASNGETAYQSRCAGCHGADLHSTDAEAPDLTDGSFKGWAGRTLAERFETIRGTMPPPGGGSFDDQTYLDILTYILKFNGVPSGRQKLEPKIE